MTDDAAFSAVGRVYGDAAFEKLKDSHVCIVGIGGVGSWVAEAMARSSVGELTLIDHDDVSATNINRQVHADQTTVGQSKVEVMAQRIALINSACVCHSIDDMLVINNIEKYIDSRFDFVVDAMDSIMFKAALINYCKRNKIPIITIGGAGGRTDPTKITITDLSKTWNDALAAKVRHRLRAKHGFKIRQRFRVECVFSTEQARYPAGDGEVSYQKPGVRGATLDCDTGYGSLVNVTASFGFFAAARVMNKLVAN